jgi:outer membrane protein assembly factor BamA
MTFLRSSKLLWIPLTCAGLVVAAALLAPHLVNTNAARRTIADFLKTHLGREVEIGGEKMAMFNFEIIFPIVSEAGVNGVVFYDTGNVYDDRIDLGDLRQSAGAGIRWNSPFAPIRLEYGWILDREEGESGGNWEFTLGGSF